MAFPDPCGIDPALLQAYRETDYVVHAGPDFVLHIDQPSAALAAYCQARQQRLEQDLQQAGWQWVRAVGSHPTNAWPPEVGCFVEGMGEAAAGEWGQAYQQNAVVWCGADATPRLLCLR